MEFHRRMIVRFVVTIVVLFPGTAWNSSFAQDTDEHRVSKPNILFIYADDMSYRDLGAYGQEKFSTPNLDYLAENGLRFTQAYSGAPECAPARASLMTGMHMGHSRIRNNRSVRGQDHLRDEDITIAEVLKNAGYATGFIGKWGIGLPGTEGVPHRQGFDLAYGFYDQSRAHGYYPNYLMKNGETVPLPANYGFKMDRLYKYNARKPDNLDGVKNRYNKEGKLLPAGVSDPDEAKNTETLFQKEALKFIRNQKNNPFFLYYTTQIPHGPVITPDLGRYQDRPWSLKHKEWAAMIGHLDQGVGRMVELLKSMDLYDDTIIFFASDHGYSMWGYFGRSPYKNDPLFNNKGPWPKGKFASTHEGGLRAPFFAFWKGQIESGQTDHLTAQYDVLATVADLAGTEAPDTDGISFAPTLLGHPEQQKTHDYLYWENGSHTEHARSVRMGKWWAYRRHPSKDVKLYDISEDVKAEHNLADEHPEVVSRVKQVFQTAHEDSDLYVNPGESKQAIKEKRKKALEAGRKQTPTSPNKTRSHPMKK